MPPVLPPGSRVLVTGANGYLALYIVKNLLEDGYIVRGVVRSLEKEKQLQDIFKSHGDKLELAVVEDMLKVSMIKAFFSRLSFETDDVERRMARLTKSSKTLMQLSTRHLQSTCQLSNQMVSSSSRTKSFITNEFIDYIQPALRMTLGVLESACKSG